MGQSLFELPLPFWQADDGRFRDGAVGYIPSRELRHMGQIVLIDTGAYYGGLPTAYCPQTGGVVSVDGVLRPAAIRC